MPLERHSIEKLPFTLCATVARWMTAENRISAATIGENRTENSIDTHDEWVNLNGPRALISSDNANDQSWALTNKISKSLGPRKMVRSRAQRFAECNNYRKKTQPTHNGYGHNNPRGTFPSRSHTCRMGVPLMFGANLCAFLLGHSLKIVTAESGPSATQFFAASVCSHHGRVESEIDKFVWRQILCANAKEVGRQPARWMPGAKGERRQKATHMRFASIRRIDHRWW